MATPALASSYDEVVNFTQTAATDLAFAGFDTSLGTLTGVTAMLSGTAYFDKDFSFISQTTVVGEITGTTESFDNGFEIRNFFAGTVFADIGVTGAITLSDYRGGPGFDCETQSEGESCTYSYDFPTEIEFADQASAASLTGFDSAFVLGFSIEKFIEVNIGVLDQTQPTGDWLANGSLKITYTYEENVSPVPLPASLPLLAVAFGGLGLATRRRKSAA